MEKHEDEQQLLLNTHYDFLFIFMIQVFCDFILLRKYVNVTKVKVSYRKFWQVKLESLFLVF